jgi:hypothetical protein
MKIMMIGLLLLVPFVTPVMAQKSKTAKPVAAGLKLKNSDMLVYEVTQNGSAYHFEVTIKEIREAIVFDWGMPEKDISGEITLEKQAREQATAYQNYFSDSSEKVFTDTATVWLSRKNYNELKKGNTILTLDNNGAERFDKKENGTLNIIYKGKPMTLKMFRTDNGKTNTDQRQIWVLDQAAQPLIVKMNLGFTIELKEIKSLE